MANPTIYQITTTNGTVYDIEDRVARSRSGGAILIRGTTTTALQDNATTNPIQIAGESYTVVNNDAVFYGAKEFVFDGTRWHEFGDMSGLGEMAKADTASTSYTPAGTVSLTGAVATVSPAGSGTVTYTPAGGVTLSGKSKVAVSKAASGSTTYTPEGTISSNPDNLINVHSASGPDPLPPDVSTYTPTGTISVNASSGTGTAFTPEGSISVNASSGAGTSYTPEGSVAAPVISLATAGSTANITPFGSAGTLPELTMTVSNGNLTFSFDKGTLPTAGTAVAVKTGDGAYSANAPAFTGTEKKFAFSGTQKKLSINGNPVYFSTNTPVPGALVFSGTAVRLETSQDVPTTASFSGTGVRLKVDTDVPTGATFTGTQATITVAPDSDISFSIEGASYSANPGMTWSQWCSSSYNTAGYKVSATGTSIENSNTRYSVYTSANVGVAPSDVIIKNEAYKHGV